MPNIGFFEIIVILGMGLFLILPIGIVITLVWYFTKQKTSPDSESIRENPTDK